MNDGVKILLDRMVTHPEEFVDELSLQGSKWSGLLNYYDNVLTLEEKKAIEAGILKIKRNTFTQKVMERLLEEPVQIEPNTYTFKTAGRATWATSAVSIQEHVLQAHSDAMRAEMQKELMNQQITKTKAEKNKTKMQQLLQNVTKKRQVY